MVGLAYFTSAGFAWRFVIALCAVFIIHAIYLTLFAKNPMANLDHELREANAWCEQTRARLSAVIAANDDVRIKFAQSDCQRADDNRAAVYTRCGAAMADATAERDYLNSWQGSLRFLSIYCFGAAVLCMIPWEQRVDLILGIFAALVLIILIVASSVWRSIRMRRARLTKT
jgi:hypothetical protein